MNIDFMAKPRSEMSKRERTLYEIYLVVSKPAHTWAAFLTVVFAALVPIISGMIFVEYNIYQVREYAQIKDTCYQDIREYFVAMCIFATVLLFILVFDPWGSGTWLLSRLH